MLRRTGPDDTLALMKAPDAAGHTPLHHSIARDCLPLCEHLLEHGVPVEGVPGQACPPLVHAIRHGRHAIVDALLRRGASPNAAGAGAHALRRDHRMAALLLAAGLDRDAAGAEGRTPLMEAVRANDVTLAALVLGLIDAADLEPRPAALGRGFRVLADVNARDARGRTALHHLADPHPLGGYHNVALLRLLLRHGADIDAADGDGHTPLHYARGHVDQTLAQALRASGARDVPAQPLKRLQSMPLQGPCLEPPDVEEDARAAVAELRRNAPAPPPPGEEDQPCFALVDGRSGLRDKGGRVVADADGRLYHAVLHKVDLRYGEYGLYVAYHLQLLHNPVSDLYVLYTSWGGIWDMQCNPQRQTTPFTDMGLAVKEFRKVFLSKTGNKWEALPTEPFEKKPKKYQWIQNPPPTREQKLRRRPAATPALLPPPGPGHVPSQLPEEHRALMALLVDVKGLRRATQATPLDVELLTLEDLDRKPLLEAKEVLLKLRDVVQRTEAIQTEIQALSNPESGPEPPGARDALHSERAALADRVLEYSNAVYEILPLQAGWQHPKALDRMRKVQGMLHHIETLLDVEYAKKVVLAARHRASVRDPLDYAYAATGATLKALSPAEDVYVMIAQYMQRGLQAGGTPPKINALFSVDCPAERNRFDRIGNHRLLWHGTHASNVIAILTQGLRVAPPDAESHGTAFGRGIYFADVFRKSWAYCGGDRGRGEPQQRVMLLCEVALGTSKAITQSQYMERPVAGTHSTKALGQSGPDKAGDLVLRGSGAVIPLGSHTNYREQAKGRFCFQRVMREKRKLWHEADRGAPAAKRRRVGTGEMAAMPQGGASLWVAGGEGAVLNDVSWQDPALEQALGELKDARLNFNEYIVYNERQVRIRYLLVLEEV